MFRQLPFLGMRGNPFKDLKSRLRAEEEARRREREHYLHRHRTTFRRWNRPVRRLLSLLADALKQSSEWQPRKLSIRSNASLGDRPEAVGWRLYWVRPFGPAGQLLKSGDILDVVSISFKLDENECPTAFVVFKEEDGRRIETNSLSLDELVAAMKALFP